MRGRAHRFVGTIGAATLALLLLVPVVLAGHSHASLSGSDACAVCVAAHHTPTAVAPGVESPRVHLVEAALHERALVAPPAPVRPEPSGRGPPAVRPALS
jgi:hypothetical protein